MINKLLDNPVTYGVFQKLVITAGVRIINDWVRAAAHGKEGGKVPDVGCGSVDKTDLLPGNYTGIDINPKYIAFCARRFNGSFLTMDATQLEFPDHSFDIVFNIGLCHHIDDNQVLTGVSEWLRVLKPGGRIIVVDAIMPLISWNLPGWVLRKADRGRFVRCWEEWQKLFEEAIPADTQLRTFSSFPYDFSGAVGTK